MEAVLFQLNKTISENYRNFIGNLRWRQSLKLTFKWRKPRWTFVPAILWILSEMQVSERKEYKQITCLKSLIVEQQTKCHWISKNARITKRERYSISSYKIINTTLSFSGLK